MSKEQALASLSKRAIALMDDDIPGYNPNTEQLVKLWQKWVGMGLKADGWPGSATLRALWLTHRPSREDVVAAALAATKWPKVDYQLGQGGNAWFPDFDAPLAQCDCSGFGAHCLGLSRNAAGAWLGALEWIESTQLVADATGPCNLVRAFPISEAMAGDLVVWPDKAGSQGHVGVVVERGPKGEIITVDCSSSGEKSGSAIQKRDRTKLWKDSKAIVARPIWYPVPFCA